MSTRRFSLVNTSVAIVTIFIGAYTVDSNEELNRVYKLPLSKPQAQELRLSDDIQKLLSTEAKPSTLLRVTYGRSESLLWFFAFIDKETRVSAVAQRSGVNYLVLTSRSAAKSRRVFIPLAPNDAADKKVDENEPQKMSDAANQLLRFLRDTYDDFEPTRRPFAASGTPAKDYADFSQLSTSENVNDWAESYVFYTSLGGDALLITKDNNVAWYQLETGQIIPKGNLQAAIESYFECSFGGREFCSSL